MKKPRPIELYDGAAECVTEEYDDHGGGAFGVQVHDSFLYDAKNVRRLIRFLKRAEVWIAHKEHRLHGKPLPRPLAREAQGQEK